MILALDDMVSDNRAKDSPPRAFEYISQRGLDTEPEMVPCHLSGRIDRKLRRWLRRRHDWIYDLMYTEFEDCLYEWIPTTRNILRAQAYLFANLRK